MLEKVAIWSCGMPASLRKSGRGRQGWNGGGLRSCQDATSLPFRTTESSFLAFQLLLPSQHARLISFRFGFGDHSFFLVEDREAGVGEDVVGIDLGNLLGNFDGFVEAVEILQGAA